MPGLHGKFVVNGFQNLMGNPSDREILSIPDGCWVKMLGDASSKV